LPYETTINFLITRFFNKYFLITRPHFLQRSAKQIVREPSLYRNGREFFSSDELSQPMATIISNYQTFTTEINQYLGKGNGVSVLFSNDNAANTVIKRELVLGYAKTVSIKEKHHLSLGVQAGYFTKHLNWHNLNFWRSD
jgi:hypothetical protein